MVVVEPPGTREPMTNVYEGAPDARQSSDIDMPTSRFRPRYRALTDDEKALHDAIKDKAAELENLLGLVAVRRGREPPVPVDPDRPTSYLPQPVAGRYIALATTALEESVMYAVKALTA